MSSDTPNRLHLALAKRSNEEVSMMLGIGRLSKEEVRELSVAAVKLLSDPQAEYSLRDTARVSRTGEAALRNWIARKLIHPASQGRDRTFRFSAAQVVGLRVMADLLPMVEPRWSVTIAKHVMENVTAGIRGRYLLAYNAGNGRAMWLDEAEEVRGRLVWERPCIAISQMAVIVEVALRLAALGK